MWETTRPVFKVNLFVYLCIYNYSIHLLYIFATNCVFHLMDVSIDLSDYHYLQSLLCLPCHASLWGQKNGV